MLNHRTHNWVDELDIPTTRELSQGDPMNYIIFAPGRALCPVIFYGVTSPQEVIDLETAEGRQDDKTELGCIVLQQFYKV